MREREGLMLEGKERRNRSRRREKIPQCSLERREEMREREGEGEKCGFRAKRERE